MITYRTGNDIDVDTFIAVLRASTLGARRPVGDRERIRKMLDAANLVVTAWEDGRMVGVARSLSDFAFCTYLSDLAVDAAYQHQGIGRELVRRTQELGGQATIFLFSAPAAEEYYPKIGFSARGGFTLSRSQLGSKDE